MSAIAQLFGVLVTALEATHLLRSAPNYIKRLPKPSDVVPPYTLWLLDDTPVPTLEPEPVTIHRGLTPPKNSTERILVLSEHIKVSKDLPGRLSAIGEDFISVLPHTTRRLFTGTTEVLWRLLAYPEAVLSQESSYSFADRRCAWIKKQDLETITRLHDPILAIARRRKSRGLHIELREGRGSESPSDKFHSLICCKSSPRSYQDLRRSLDSVFRIPWTRGLIAIILTLRVIAPWPFLFFESTRALALLAIGLASATRLMTSVRDGFCYSHFLTWPILEPLWLISFYSKTKLPVPKWNEVQYKSKKQIINKELFIFPSLDNSALGYSIRHFNDDAPTQEIIFQGQYQGKNLIGIWIDAILHSFAEIRALRWRQITIVSLANALKPIRILSIPCGAGIEVTQINAPSSILVDHSFIAREVATKNCSQSNLKDFSVFDGTALSAPTGPYNLIIFVGQVEHLEDAALIQTLSALRGLLPSGGALITSTATSTALFQKLGCSLRPRTASSLSLALNQAGYIVEFEKHDLQNLQVVILARPRPSK